MRHGPVPVWIHKYKNQSIINVAKWCEKRDFPERIEKGRIEKFMLMLFGGGITKSSHCKFGCQLFSDPNDEEMTTCHNRKAGGL